MRIRARVALIFVSAMSSTVRVLLDEGFPTPTFSPMELDRTVEYIRLDIWDPSLANRSTPDWIVVLLAAEAKFDVMVTDDYHMLEDEKTLVALMTTDLSLVTWPHGMQDPVTRWAQLIAHMPYIVRKLQFETRPSIFSIPSIRLAKGDHIYKASGLLGKLAVARGETMQQLKAAATRTMVSELNHRGLSTAAARLA